MQTLISTGHNHFQVSNLTLHKLPLQHKLKSLSTQPLQHQLLCHCIRQTQPLHYPILLCPDRPPQRTLLLCPSTIPTQPLQYPILLCPTQHLLLLCPSTRQTQPLQYLTPAMSNPAPIHSSTSYAIIPGKPSPKYDTSSV